MSLYQVRATARATSRATTRASDCSDSPSVVLPLSSSQLMLLRLCARATAAAPNADCYRHYPQNAATFNVCGLVSPVPCQHFDRNA